MSFSRRHLELHRKEAAGANAASHATVPQNRARAATRSLIVGTCNMQDPTRARKRHGSARAGEEGFPHFDVCMRDGVVSTEASDLSEKPGRDWRFQKEHKPFAA